MVIDAAVFCISQPHLSAARERLLSDSIHDASSVKTMVVRLEGTGPALAETLSQLADSGHTKILVQPFGLPFSQSLAAWLPGALTHWQAVRPEPRPELVLGADLIAPKTAIAHMVEEALTAAQSVPELEDVKPSLGIPGWENPPAFKHHLLVCTGPRCHFRDAPSLKTALAEELADAGLSRACLTATTGCLYPCNKGPIVATYPRGEWYRLADRAAVKRFVTDVIGKGIAQPDLIIHRVNSCDNDVKNNI